MQAAKKAVETVKETAANIGASAKSGLEKTKATVQEKTERMTAHDPIQKDMATEKKEERIHQAELEKQEAREHNSAAKQAPTAGHTAEGQHTATGPGPRTATNSVTGEFGHPMWADQISKAPEQHGLGHGLGQSVMASHMEGQYTPTTPTGPGTQTATYSPTSEHGLLHSPIRGHQVSSMPGQHEHDGLGLGLGLGHGLGELAEEMMGSNPTGTNPGTGRTTGHNTHVGATAPGSPRFS